MLTNRPVEAEVKNGGGMNTLNAVVVVKMASDADTA